MSVKSFFRFNFFATNITCILWFLMLFHMTVFRIINNYLAANRTSPVRSIDFSRLTVLCMSIFYMMFQLLRVSVDFVPYFAGYWLHQMRLLGMSIQVTLH